MTLSAEPGPTGPSLHFQSQRQPPPYHVTFDAEARLKHAATLWIVLGYLMIAGWALGFLLLLASLSTVT